MFDKLRHLFLPQHTNNFKARALHPQAFVFYILLIFVLQVSLKVVRTNFPDVLGFATDISAGRLLDLTNQERKTNGLPPLSLSPTLSTAATNKAEDMFAKNYWAHYAPDGKTPWDFINSVGYHYTYAGENLAKNFNDSQSVVNAWMASPSHRENMLKSQYHDIGFAVVNGKLNGEDTTLVVEMFGTTNEPQPIAQNPPAVPPQQIAQANLAPTQAPEITVAPTTAANPVLGNSQVKVAGTSSLPLFNINKITKTLSLALIGFLLGLLAIDSIFIWHRRTIRVAGHNFAHMLFLIALLGVVYLTGSGVIK